MPFTTRVDYLRAATLMPADRMTQTFQSRRMFAARVASAATVKFLRPDPLLALVGAGSDRLHRHRTGRFLHTGAAFQDPGGYTEGVDLGLEPGNLRLENGDLILFLFYRVVDVCHFLFFSLVNNQQFLHQNDCRSVLLLNECVVGA